jgi:hypothetical protein
MQFPPMSNLVYRCFKTHHNHSLLEQKIQMMINTFSVFPCYTEICMFCTMRGVKSLL